MFGKCEVRVTPADNDCAQKNNVACAHNRFACITIGANTTSSTLYTEEQRLYAHQ